MNWTVETPSGDTQQVTLTASEIETLALRLVEVDQLLLSILPPGAMLPGRPTFTMDMLR